MWRGIENLYNYKLDLAISNFDSVMIIHPEHPVAPFVKIAALWLNTQIHEGYDSSYSVIYNEVERTLPFYESLIEKNDKNAEAFLYLGCSYGIRARVDLARKEWLNVIYSSYIGYREIRKAEFLNPELIDVNMPFGLLEYYAGMSSLPVQILANIVGINPNKEKGLEHLLHAVEARSYSWIESAMTLVYCWLYFENDLIKAELLSFELMTSFPDNPFFGFLYGEAVLRQGNVKEYEKLIIKYENIIQSSPPILSNECELKLKYLQAIHAFQNKNFNTVFNNTIWIENNYGMEMDWLLGLSWLLRGKTLDVKSERENAVKYYKKAADLDNTFAYIDWAKEYIRHPYVGIMDDPYFSLLTKQE